MTPELRRSWLDFRMAWLLKTRPPLLKKVSAYSVRRSTRLSTSVTADMATGVQEIESAVTEANSTSYTKT